MRKLSFSGNCLLQVAGSLSHDGDVTPQVAGRFSHYGNASPQVAGSLSHDGDTSLQIAGRFSHYGDACLLPSESFTPTKRSRPSTEETGHHPEIGCLIDSMLEIT